MSAREEFHQNLLTARARSAVAQHQPLERVSPAFSRGSNCAAAGGAVSVHVFASGCKHHASRSSCLMSSGPAPGAVSGETKQLGHAGRPARREKMNYGRYRRCFSMANYHP